ncbi:MAG TPA: antitoxin Xre/MbcA/ParS toxin-binding domain-containing protein [Reyranella sp.]|nr:antitoxin Xre/MbcA/ParS toxin-binding domain-containing protein [Reyranella sp.]
MASKGNTRRSRLRAAGGRGFAERPKKSFPALKDRLSRNVAVKGGKLPVEDVAQSLGMSKAQLAETAGLSIDTLYRTNRAGSAKTQARLKEMLEIVDRVSDWAGGKDQAMAWYRAEPIPEFGDRTAESLVKDGKATAVRDYLDHVALGGFA